MGKPSFSSGKAEIWSKGKYSNGYFKYNDEFHPNHTIAIGCGANPGMITHFVKLGLFNMKFSKSFKENNFNKRFKSKNNKKRGKNIEKSSIS